MARVPVPDHRLQPIRQTAAFLFGALAEDRLGVGVKRKVIASVLMAGIGDGIRISLGWRWRGISECAGKKR